MRVWILPALWDYLSKYWDKFMHPSNQLASACSLKSPVQSGKIFTSNLSTRNKRKLCKFNFNDISDSAGNSRLSKLPKKKRIQKGSAENFKKKVKKDVKHFDTLEIKTNYNFIDDSGQQISSIGARENSESVETVQQILQDMETKINLSNPYRIAMVNNFRKQETKERALVNQLFGHSIKDRIVVDPRNLPFGIKSRPRNNRLIYDATIIKPVQTIQFRKNL